MVEVARGHDPVHAICTLVVVGAPHAIDALQHAGLRVMGFQPRLDRFPGLLVEPGAKLLA